MSQSPGSAFRAANSPGPSGALLRSDCHRSGFVNCFPAVQELSPVVLYSCASHSTYPAVKNPCLFPSTKAIQRSPGSLHKGILKCSNTGPAFGVSEKESKPLESQAPYPRLYACSRACEWRLETDMPCGVYSVYNGCVCIGL